MSLDGPTARPSDPSPTGGFVGSAAGSGARALRAAIWLPGLAVAVGAAAAIAHGLYETAVAARVPAAIAWLYPLITDGLALVAYAATARLPGSAARYAWAVVVLAAGLSGLAQAAYLADDTTLDTSVALRFGVGAWPAIAAAITAHLLYLLATHGASAPGAVPGTTGPCHARPTPRTSDGTPCQPSAQPFQPTFHAEFHPCQTPPPECHRPCQQARIWHARRSSRRPGIGRARPRRDTPPATAPCPPSPS